MAEREIIKRAKATILKVQQATKQAGKGDDYVVKLVEAAKVKEQELLAQGIQDHDMEDDSENEG
jgi:hypothetical protein